MITYGIDAPRVVGGLFFGGICYLLVALGLYYYFNTFNFLILICIIFSIPFFLTAFLLLVSSLVGKRIQAKKLINSLQLTGNQKVLDVGCGRGLLLILAAKKLTTGQAVGIDIWQKQDLSGNTKQAAEKNIINEGVQNKVKLYNADVRNLPFEKNSFDVVVSSMTIHNIYDKAERKKALGEMARILKPGGTIVIQDFQHTKEYAQVFRQLGLLNVTRSGLIWYLFPPSRIIRASK